MLVNYFDKRILPLLNGKVEPAICVIASLTPIPGCLS